MSAKAKIKGKSRKYHYLFFYSRGDYFKISGELEAAYPKFFYGSGMSMVNGCFDIHFHCTPAQYKSIIAFARRRYGKNVKVERRK